MEFLSAPSLILSLAAILLIYAAISDAVRFRIPNSTNAALLVLFPLYAFVAPSPIAWAGHLITFAVVLALGYGLFIKNIAGAGDIKLIAVLALWAGPAFIAPFLFVTAITGGILCLGIGLGAFLRQRLSPSQEATPLSKTPLPYGIAIAIGGLCTLALLSHPDLLSTRI